MNSNNQSQDVQMDKEHKGPNKNQIMVDGTVYTSDKPQVSKVDILETVNKDPTCRYEVYQEINPHKQLVLLGDGQVADVSQPGIEKFVTKFISEVTYFLSDEPFQTTETTLTPNQILTRKYGLNANQYYLKQITGQTQVSYKDKPDEPITICPDLKFVSIFTGPMTVS